MWTRKQKNDCYRNYLIFEAELECYLKNADYNKLTSHYICETVRQQDNTPAFVDERKPVFDIFTRLFSEYVLCTHW